MEQLSYKQNEQCRAIAFNKDSTLMIAGCGKLIKVFKFKDDQLKEVEQLSQHSNIVICLHFLKKSYQFISASYDSTVIIWEQNQNNQWQTNQVLKSHQQQIRCIIINQSEDILMTGSFDRTIKFWQKQNNEWKFRQKQNNIWSCKQSFDCLSLVWSISFNNQEDKLIASFDDKQILIIQLYGKQWIIKQRLSVEQYGFRLSFINQDQFVFQPYDRQHLIIFDYDAKDQTFKQGQVLQYSKKAVDGGSLFPIRYISSIGLLMVKNDHYVHLIKRQQSGQFKFEKSINFSTTDFCCGLTEDGRNLAKWNFESKEIQIRKFEY